jgi:cytochrome c553
MIQSARNFLLAAFALAAGSMSVDYGPSAAAQPATVKPVVGDDLRAAYATSADVAEGKRVADASCSACHGANGISSIKDVPHLAGQRPGYLYIELRAYQSGARGDSTMGAVVKSLNDSALVKAAAYYASLDPAQLGSTSSAKSTAAQPDPVQVGKTASAACAGCHGDAGISKIPGTPNLVGLHPNYLVAAMKGYKGGQRKNDVMKPMISAVADADLSNIALYYALQKPARAQTPAAGDQAAGNAAAAACAGCHGDKGISTNPATPSLAGQDAQYMAAALRAYKDGVRSDETMKGVAASLDEPAVKNLAAFYANQQPQPTNVRKPLTTAEWAQRCDRCHGVNGNSTDPRLPALAAQRVEYLEKTLNAYRTGERKSPQMAAMSEGLTEADVENLATYYSHQKARAVVYVALPAK